MTDDKLEAMLLSRAFQRDSRQSDSNTPPRDWKLTRGQLIAGSGLVGAAIALGGLNDAPRIHWRGRVLVVEYRDGLWKIDPRLFAPGATVQWRNSRTASIVLRRALLPGTDLAVDFSADLNKETSGWQITLTFPRLGFKAKNPLEPWISGATPIRATVPLREFNLGGTRVTLSGNEITLAVGRLFDFSFTGDRCVIGMPGPAACAGSSLSLQPRFSASHDIRAALLGQTTSPCTTFELGGPFHGKRITLARFAGSEGVAFEPDDVSRYIGEAVTTTSGREGVVLMESGGALLGRRNRNGVPRYSRVLVERAALVVSTGLPNNHAAIGARLTRTAHALDLGSVVATISGDDSLPLYGRFGSEHPNGVRLNANLHALCVPIRGADVANVVTGATPVEILFHSLSSDQAADVLSSQAADFSGTASKTGSTGSRILVDWEGSKVNIPLDGARLNIRRSADLLNLTYLFEGFDIRVRRGRAVLVRRPAARKDGSRPPASITVHFPPQHIAEQYFDVQHPTACMPFPQPLPSTTSARLSGASRIAFCVPDEATDWVQRPLTVDALTEWSELCLIVNRRAALEEVASFEEQMNIPGILSGTRLANATNLVADTLQPPSDHETSLEMIGRLLLSPSGSAKWLTPRGPVEAASATLWHARLDRHGRQTVRALWSNTMRAGHFPECITASPECITASNKPDVAARSQADDPSMLALTANDHWQIVAQSSVYGLIALRRIVDKPKPNDKVEQAQHDLPRSRVVRPHTDYESLKEIDHLRGDEPDSGFAVPSPFADANIVMTSIGGSLTADWHGEPPILLQAIPGLSLERLNYWSQLARDIRIDVYKKGYLLPLGIRASYVAITERRFIRHPELGYPIAYELKRRFCVIQRPIKLYPGLNQPFEGRDFPARQIEMLTTTTPDLINPEGSPCEGAIHLGDTSVSQNGGRVRVDGLPESVLIFWPRLLTGPPGSPGDVAFKWAIDGDASPVLSNLLFVENSAMALGPQLAHLVNYYRTLHGEDAAWSPLRTVRDAGGRRRYAPAEKDGETSFDTHSWLLSARGRLLPGGTGGYTESFQMDGRMEGADQPPFYPVLERARITIQSLDHLIGRPQGPIDVAFDSIYVASGFNTSENKASIYLDVLGPDIALDVTNQGNSLGGLAKPNTLVVGISRRIGIIGGRKAAATASALPTSTSIRKPMPAGVLRDQPTAPAAFVAQNSVSPYDLRQARRGIFDPSEFFGGIGNAKLLGLIKLSDILSASGVPIQSAPRLLEKVGYGALGATTPEEALMRIRALAARELKELSDRLETLRVVAEKTFALRDVHFRDLYPSLDAHLMASKRSIGAATDAILKANALIEIGDAVDAMVIDCRALISDIERTIQDPVPPLIQSKLDQFASTWVELKRQTNAEYLERGRSIARDVIRPPIVRFCEELDKAHLGEVLFGTDPEMRCHDIVENPRDSLSNIEHSLFAQVFGGPIAELLSYFRGYEAEVTARLEWPRAVVSEAIRAKTHEALNSLASRLRPPMHGETDNILIPEAQRVFANAIVESFARIVENASSAAADAPNIETIERALDKIEPAIRAGQTSIEATVRSRSSLFKPEVNSDTDAIVERFIQLTITSYMSAATAAVTPEVARLRAVLLTRLEESRAQAITRLSAGMQRIVAAMTVVARFSSVAEAGRGVGAWCEVIAGPGTALAVAFADDFASGLLGDTSDISSKLSAIITGSDAISLPVDAPATIRAEFERARTAINAATQQLASLVLDLSGLRTRLHTLRTDVESGKDQAICRDVAAFLRPTSRIMQLRRDAVAQLGNLAKQLAAIDALLGTTRRVVARSHTASARNVHPFSTGELPKGVAAIEKGLDTLVEAVASLFESLTSIGNAGAAKWNDIERAIKLLSDNDSLRGVPGYIQDLASAANTLVVSAQRYRGILRDSTLNANRLSAVADDIVAYSLESEKRLAALALQTASLSTEQASLLGIQTARILSGSAAPFVAFHRAASAILLTLVETLKDPVVSLVLNKKIVDNLEQAKRDVDIDTTYLEKVVDAQDDVKRALAAAQDLIAARWNSATGQSPAVVRALSVLADLVEIFLRGDLAALIDLREVRQAVEDVSNRLRVVLSQLLPTRTELSYGWETPIGDFPVGDDRIFFMTGGRSTRDLTIDARVTVDFVTGERSTSIKGTLNPFTLHLLGGSVDIASIQFAETTFESKNGGAPSFNLKIANVSLGTLIEFLKPLQAWMNPGGDNGFYVRPHLPPLPPGLEAGYIYDAGLIQLGELQFINVALSIAARLYFGDKPAEFEFRFASAERPFLVAAPPYGGGGYLRLLSDGQSIIEFALDVRAGAVVAIKFGPLSASGRVTAGITLEQRRDRRSVTATVEAVGEGNIACFSICVILQVRLTDQDGELTGSTAFSFTFKAGFLKFSFGFTASYTIAGRSASASRAFGLSQTIAVPRSCVDPGNPDARRIVSASPQKATQWDEYRKRIAMAVLED